MLCQIKSSKAAPPFRQIYRKMKISPGAFEVRHRNITQNAVDGLNGFFKGNNNNARIHSQVFCKLTHRQKSGLILPSA